MSRIAVCQKLFAPRCKVRRLDKSRTVVFGIFGKFETLVSSHQIHIFVELVKK